LGAAETLAAIPTAVPTPNSTASTLIWSSCWTVTSSKTTQRCSHGFSVEKLLPVKIAQMNARLSFVLYIHDWYVRSLDGGAKNRNFVTTLPTDS
jgi:hypothetical protein